jgi:MscS family membrane protein
MIARMEQMLAWMKTATVAGNQIWRIAALFLVTLAGLLAGRLARFALMGAADRLKRAGEHVSSETCRALAGAVGFVALAVALRLSLTFLQLRPSVSAAAQTAAAVLIVLAIGFTAYRLVDVVEVALHRQMAGDGNGMHRMLVPLVRRSLQVTIIVLTALQAATVLSDKPVTSLLAGLGVGGLALALAAQETIKNFFGALVIFADKPFAVGERILVEGHDGVIEEVGFRSTRLRTLEGNLVTIPNGELANRFIVNFARRPYIRRIVTLGIPYDTPAEKVERALEILREILRDHEGQHPDYPPRVFFQDFGASSLNLQAIYWYHPPDYWAFMAFGENVNRRILERFNGAGIEFAFPTQTLYLAGDRKRPPASPPAA